jgi:hypothetical protein
MRTITISNSGSSIATIPLTLADLCHLAEVGLNHHRNAIAEGESSLPEERLEAVEKLLKALGRLC